jgi:outer membrane cobalamin receptor
LDNNVLQFGYDWLETYKTGQAFLTFGCANPVSLTTCNDAARSAGGNISQIFHRSKGLYFRDTLNLSSTDRIVVGYRSENYDQRRTADYGYGPSTFSVEGKASASELEYSKAFQPNLTGHLRLSRNFRIANADDNSNVAYAPPDYISPVPLRVQNSKDVDIGLNHQMGSVTTELSLFRSQVNNEIGFDPSGCGYACNVNFEPTQRKGLNFRQKLPLSKEFTLRTNLQYVNARFVEGAYSGKQVPGVAAFSGNLSLDYQWTARDQIALTTRWAQSRYMSGDFENSQSKLPRYAVSDLSYFIREKNWSIVASIINLTNKKYSDTGIYKSNYSQPYHLTLYPNPGRSLSLNGRYVF